MRALLLTVMMLCACLFVPGCFGDEEEEVVCEDTIFLSQFDTYLCGFELDYNDSSSSSSSLTPASQITIDVTVLGDIPVDIISLRGDAYTDWATCWRFDYYEELSEFGSMGATFEGELQGDISVPYGGTEFYVILDNPESCDPPVSGTTMWEGKTPATFEGFLEGGIYSVFLQENRDVSVELVGGDEKSRFFSCEEDDTCNLYEEPGYTYLGYIYAAHSDDWEVRFSGDVTGDSDIMIQAMEVIEIDFRVSIT
ncbi:uncharacterized protein METZ01_LOCUS272256 [marine metagenome]|uniref:Uncharacterized protein n=1 Tax=marine metagenome TaxID=408172 RepID=A0A382K7P3_9ZZZZ